ncbi:hypothetical protein H0O00_05105 [Candidatus Micrarchaeota archaeon]|nr:hypothetical protein [Candidatus Micrarchaeota archaeon]
MNLLAVARSTPAVPVLTMGTVVAMANRFARYKPETERTVRKVEVSGDELSYLRQRCEMLRSMTPEQALQVIEFHKDLNAFQALDLAKREKKLIVPNDVHDRILTETDKKYTVWTGTLVIYEAPDKSFGEKVVFDSEFNKPYTVSFEVPEKFRGKRNCALVVEHPDFEFVYSGNNRFELKTAEGHVSLLEYFPKASKEWYEYDERFRIPVGEPKRINRSLRRLYRNYAEYIGSLLREVNDFFGGYGRRGVGAGVRWSDASGVALF